VRISKECVCGRFGSTSAEKISVADLRKLCARTGYMKPLDSFTEDGARALIGRRAVDADGKEMGALERIWLDPSTYLVEFAAIRIDGLTRSTHIVPARYIRFNEADALIRLDHPCEFVRRSPYINPRVELSEVEKEEIDAYYGCFVPLHRVSDIKEIRPEDALDDPGLPRPTAAMDELLLHREGGEKIDN
jgi:hypothetical protein